MFNTRGDYDTINFLAKAGADNVRLQRAIAQVLPPGVQVVSGQTVTNERSSAVSNTLSFLSTADLAWWSDDESDDRSQSSSLIWHHAGWYPRSREHGPTAFPGR